jgi:HSP20 family protein
MANNWNPIRDLVLLQERMNRLFEDATHRHTGDTGSTDDEQDIERAEWTPQADVFEKDEAFVIALDLPAIDRSSLDISVDHDRLVVRGARKAETENRRRSERPHGRFFRKFTLPSDVNQSAIAADYKDGELRITLPRRRPEQSRKVEIKIS